LAREDRVRHRVEQRLSSTLLILLGGEHERSVQEVAESGACGSVDVQQ
jgi:hypothetical protein